MCFSNSLLDVSLLPCKALCDFGKLFPLHPPYLIEFLVSSFFGLIRSKVLFFIFKLSVSIFVEEFF